MSDGEIRDLVDLDHVIAAFRAFHQAGLLPASLDWEGRFENRMVLAVWNTDVERSRLVQAASTNLPG